MKHTPKYCTNNAQPSLMSAVAGGSAAAVNPQRVYLFSVELLHVKVRIRAGVKFGLKLVSNFKNDYTNKKIYIYIYSGCGNGWGLMSLRLGLVIVLRMGLG